MSIRLGFYKLKQAGDHIKFLGLNIVQGPEENYITVGKQYIKMFVPIFLNMKKR